MDALEFLQGAAADALRGRVGRNQVGELAFQRLQFGNETVILAVGNFLPGLDKVQMVVVADLIAQLGNASRGFGAVHARRERAK